MKNKLIVIDMQNDFINGALGTKEAEGILEKVNNKIHQYEEAGKEVIFTMDTHNEDYNETLEGKKLPVPHCIKDTNGWKLATYVPKNAIIFEKPTFGSVELAKYLNTDNVEIIGVCTGICVLSNCCVLRAYNPDLDITVDANCCACVTPETHETALAAMETLQINVVR